MTTATAIRQAIIFGMNTNGFARATGCGRVYVEIKTTPTIDQLMTLDKKALRAIKKDAAKIMPIVESAVNGTGTKWINNRIYVGYDNASGKELARGEAIASQLKSIGVGAYMVAEAD